MVILSVGYDTNVKGVKMQEQKKTNNENLHGYVHCLSNTERMFLWSLRSRIAMVARIIGNVSEKELKRTLHDIRRMHPLVGCKIVFDKHHNAFCSTDSVPENILRIAPRRSDTQWFDEIRHEHLIPFELEKGPLVRFILVYSPQVSELIAFAHHSICDGTAMANLIHDILICYSNPAEDVQVIHPPTLTDYILKKENSFSSMSVEEVAISNYNNLWKENSYIFSQADFSEIYATYWRKRRYNMVLLQLEPKETWNLVAQCREKGITMVSAITAAFLAARQEIMGFSPEDKNTIGIPFDLRRHLENNKAFCFFAGDFNLNFSYNQNKSLWENAQELHRVIQERVTMLDSSALDMRYFDPTLIDAIFSYAPYVQKIPEAFNKTENLSAFAKDSNNIAFAISQKVLSKHPNVIVTNLGRLNFPEIYNDLKLDRIFFVPPANESVPLILGGVGFNDNLAFSMIYLEKIGKSSPFLTDNVIHIRNRMLEYLGFLEKANERAI